jgi:hypothetical protein
MSTTRRFTRLVRRLDEASIRRQFQRYTTLIGVDLARGGGTAKAVRRGNHRAEARFMLRMLFIVSPFMATGLILMYFAYGRRANVFYLFGLFVLGIGYLVEIYILTTNKYLDAARSAPALLTRTIFLIEAFPEKWKDLSHRGLINKHLELVARLYAQLPNQLHGGDPQSRKLFRDWGSELATSVRDLKQQVAHPTTTTSADLLCRLSSDLNSALDGRWSDIPQAVPVTDLHIDSPRQRAAWLALSAILLSSAILILVAYSSKLGSGGEFVASLCGALGLMALGRAGISIEGLTRAKEALDKMWK